LVEKCLNIVEDFKQSLISKQEAFITISKVVAATSNEVTDQAESFIAGPYFDMLEQWSNDLERTRAFREHDPARQSEERDFVPPREDGHERESSADEGEPIKKRSKLDLSCLGRAEQSFKGGQLSANLTRTNEILLNWSQDPKEVRRRLMYHRCCPEFHEAGWAEIVAGKCINLDAVHSIISSSRTIDKCTETIGDIEIKFATATEAVSKKITTSAQWSAAWNRTSRAIKFAFPHREDELAAYGEYINDKFDCSVERAHERIIRFNKAVRNRAANSRRVELSDFSAFADIYESHFLSDGRHHDEDKQSKLGASARDKTSFNRREPCRKWNSGECSRSAQTCRYAHVCSHEQDGRLCARRHTEARHFEESKSKPT
jgi:hypothetical protein